MHKKYYFEYNLFRFFFNSLTVYLLSSVLCYLFILFYSFRNVNFSSIKIGKTTDIFTSSYIKILFTFAYSIIGKVVLYTKVDSLMCGGFRRGFWKIELKFFKKYFLCLLRRLRAGFTSLGNPRVLSWITIQSYLRIIKKDSHLKGKLWELLNPVYPSCTYGYQSVKL